MLVEMKRERKRDEGREGWRWGGRGIGIGIRHTVILKDKCTNLLGLRCSSSVRFFSLFHFRIILQKIISTINCNTITRLCKFVCSFCEIIRQTIKLLNVWSSIK